ncbi:unnamed protein product [Cyprideis torosa]|uniref:NSFL1 cofactor p47 n=1 Tax=Cyprideis torosa TaxID=163714 RepID=A0A7R8W577_9CRUS|nr:unnamed protein product [Cyprideis torosa]CAG0881409.1 unnamed protein product [Cyprideis torosa]
MSDNNKTELTSQFQAITGAESDRAKFFLDAANWDVAAAVSSFFDSDQQTGNATRPESSSPMSSGPASPVSIEEVTPAGGASGARSQSLGTGSPGKRGVIRTIPSTVSDSSSEDEGQAFYAGGPSSGQQVLGPKKKKDIVQVMFDEAKKHGAEVVENVSGGTSATAPQVFTGTGYTLGTNEGGSTVVAGAAPKAKPRTVALRLWKDGFTVGEDGPYRRYDDPANREFLVAVRRGEIPQELIREANGGHVHLDMVDHRTEEFSGTASKVPVFTGTGHLLGSPTPVVIGAASFSSPADREATEEVASREVLNLRDGAPVTSIQLRLSDGQKLTVKTNLSHTLQQVRQYLLRVRPEYQTRSFIFMTTFPNRELADESKSIEELKLQNAVITLRLK